MKEKDRAMDHPSRAQTGCDTGGLGLPGVRGVGGGGRGPRPEPVWASWGNPENSLLAAKEQGGLRN